MHKANIFSVLAIKNSFGHWILISSSIDGVIKFWKILENGNLEFLKKINDLHSGSIKIFKYSNGTTNSDNNDNTYFASLSSNNNKIKIFDINLMDIINIIDLKFIPGTLCWANYNNRVLLIVTSKLFHDIYIYDPFDSSQNDHTIQSHIMNIHDDHNESPNPSFTSYLYTTSTLHKHPIICLNYNFKYNCVVSSDTIGNIEYWLPNENFDTPKDLFALKSNTNLFLFRKKKLIPVSIGFSSDFENFIILSYPDNNIRLFNFKSAKVFKKFDESIDSLINLFNLTKLNKNSTNRNSEDKLLFNKKISLEKNLINSDKINYFLSRNAIFTNSNNFILYPSINGIKLIDLSLNKCIKILGKFDINESLHASLDASSLNHLNFQNLTLVQNSDSKLGSTDNPKFLPLLIAIPYNSNRFYIFNSNPSENFQDYKHNRDVLNENLNLDSINKNKSLNYKLKFRGSKVILHTTFGDIKLKLFPEYAPLAVENFITHCGQNYYNNLTFHRVIKSFMIQTGDPNGDGTGGESIWHKYFSDEFNPDVRFNKPYMVGMANIGENTNGSQFFITTAKAEWLNDKHTIFAEVTGGIEVVKNIENVKTNQNDVPEDPPIIISTNFQF
ncbi:uncharacterized protein ASCRUDRAFT_78993 [Ascoidea rubescens DSM 1968]|uniref:peptidylprolyl isomerase n=1 Tax=Ascoidea rubescens DSM 1968 TaxID=1344418 RepID=A0A1D2VR60_9ASCO|nr:hypothetical protein ASCRUDRAFT_78993 [Ascoidea rubescens DSM 1968]ODV64047.1 hypothetical protein ASCRUDRAFT_78993 [Ascoidea rubescens DSM 1968]